MAPRLELHALLVELVSSNEEEVKVYFQPPPNVQMQYPCIVYNREDIDTEYAANKPYKHMKRYEVKVIDRDPDSVLHEKVGMLPMASYDRFYTADNLNHDVYTLYF